jgi:MinD superfamily P-loop ATPase
MIIAVASGKGGTGKTTVATNLALVLHDAQYIDCDVEEPNAHLFLSPHIEKTIPVTISVPVINEDKCTRCGRCAEACEFNAMAVFPQALLVFNELCHGCGVCSYVCPEDAVTEQPREIGIVEVGNRDGIDFVDGILNIGEPMAPPIISMEKSLIDKAKTVILDAPPGTSCPVIETVKESDFCLLVTEPTPFGLNDLKLAVEMLRSLDIPMGVVINRADVGNEGVRQFCSQLRLPILLEIPMDRRLAEWYSNGVPAVLQSDNYRTIFLQLFERIKTYAA